MALLDRLMNLAGYEKRSAAEPSWAALAPGIGYTAGLSARASENLSTVLACVTAISRTLASVPAIVYRNSGGNRIEQPEHPLARLLNGTAGKMTGCDLREHLVASTLLTGNGLAEIVGAGPVRALEYVPWANVSVVELPSGRLAYDVSDGRGRTRRLLDTEVVHLKDRTDDGKIGRSALARAADTVAGVASANRFASSFLTNGASPSGVIEAAAGTNLGVETKTKMREALRERHEGTANAGRIMLLEPGLSWKGISISPEDAELLESRKFGVVELCRVFNVPPPIVQAYENNTFTNAATAGRWFAMFCLTPWARKIEAEFSRAALPAGGEYALELDLSGFLRGDPETRWAAHKIAIDAGVLDPDEVRELEGWNRRPASAQPAVETGAAA